MILFANERSNLFGRSAGVILVLLLYFSAALAQIEAPKVISNPDPVYPREAKDAGLGGKVLVHLTIDKNGKASVGNAFGPNALCSNLNDKRVVSMRKAAIEAAKQATFGPPMQAGKAIEVEIVMTYNFDPRGSRPKDPMGENKPTLVDFGVINGRALRLPAPAYPSNARSLRVSGSVGVSIVINEEGNVYSAGAVSGHPALLEAAVGAACSAKFAPTILNGRPVEVHGIVTYNFYP